MPGTGLFGNTTSPMEPGGMAGAMTQPPPFMIDRPQSNVPVEPAPQSSFAPVDSAMGSGPGAMLDQEMIRKIQQYMAQRGITQDMRRGYEQMMGAGQSGPFSGF